MREQKRYVSLICAGALLLGAVLACGRMSKPAAEWTKARRIAGKEQKLSHISGLVIDDKFAYVTMGGTVADQNEGTSGLRRVALDSGAVTMLDDGSQNVPQSDYGGMAIDEKFVYWNAGGNIWRIPKDGGTPEAIATEHVGIGADIAVDDKKIYWANHGYYSPNNPILPSPVYAVSKGGGKTEIFADQQHIPHSLVIDEKFVYWLTPTSICKQAKAGGSPQVIYQATDREGVDEMTQDGENLYFGFRGAGESRWALRKISKEGGEPQTIIKRYSLKPVAIDETSIYFFDEEGLTADLFCKVSKDGGKVTVLDKGYATGVIAQSKTLVYIASMDDIYSFTK